MLFDFDHPNVWERLRETKKHIVLYGMGNGCDKVLDNCGRLGIHIAGVMASDSFARYQDYRGFTVKKESDFDRELGEYIVGLCFGSSLPEVMEHIREVGRRHELLIPVVPVTGDGRVDDDFIDVHKSEITEAYDSLADGESKRVYKGVLDFLYTGRLEYLDAIESGKAGALRDILRLNNERYLDLGAYRGDTVDEFLRYTDGYREILAVEPNPKNHRKLSDHLRDIDNAEALNIGIAGRSGRMTVSSGGGRMASLSAGSGVSIPVSTVDELAFSPTYIKADIEGMEGEMLLGAAETLKTRPKLNIAAYHRIDDLFRLILRLRELCPDYDIYLRKHPYIPCWDLNIYAV